MQFRFSMLATKPQENACLRELRADKPGGHIRKTKFRYNAAYFIA